MLRYFVHILDYFYFCCSVMSDSVAPRTAAHQASMSIANSRSLLELMSIESVMPSNHLIFFVPFSSYLQSFPASGSFPMTQFFACGGQNTAVSASSSVLLLRECSLLSSVSSQQRFEVMDIKALSVSQLSDSPCYSSRTDQFYLENKGKYILKA